MKRLICALLLVCMLLLLCACGQTVAPAEELETFAPGGADFAPTLLAKKGFDPNTIQSRKTFSRSDSGLGWTYYNVYRESYSDGFVIFGIHIESSGTDPDCILLYTRILDRSNNIYFDVDGITFNIGGKSYSFPELEVQERQSMTVLQGDDCYKFIKALADNSTV